MKKIIKKLTILHSNDLHGDFLADEIDKNLIGGVSLLSGYVSKIRKEEKNTLYMIAGDMFRGSVIDSEFKGVSTIDIMNLLGPDIVSLGNHEFDYGISHLVFLEKCAKFPIVNANIYIKTLGNRLFNSHKIINIDGMKIMVIGVITEDIMNNSKTDNLLGSFVNVKQAAKEVGIICNNYKTDDIDFTILLTHIGFDKDKELASLLDPNWGVDVIIGGHSHTILDKPYKENNILIVQAGIGTDQIGKFDININTNTNSVDSYNWELIPIDQKHCPKDPSIEAVLNKYKDETDRKYGRIITKLNRELTHPIRNKETEIGNLFADILMESLKLDIMVLGSGSLRLKTFGPLITLKDLTEMYPYNDKIYEIKLTGEDIYKMFNMILRQEAFDEDCHTEFYQISKGLCINYSKSKNNIINITLNNKKIKKDNKIYKIGLQEYHFNNLKDFLNLDLDDITKNGVPKVVSTSTFDILEEKLTLSSNLDSKIENRYNFVE